MGRPSAGFLLRTLRSRNMLTDLSSWDAGLSLFLAESPLIPLPTLSHSEGQGEEGGVECVLGLLYEYGIGVAQNKEKAIEFYERGSEKGHPIAQAVFAWLLDKEKRDPDRVLRLYQSAAAKGNVAAQCNLVHFSFPLRLFTSHFLLGMDVCRWDSRIRGEYSKGGRVI